MSCADRNRGPGQSGKTTLCRTVFPDHRYVNLAPLDQREFDRQDPRGLLAEYPDGLFLDEIQYVPELLVSWRRRVAIEFDQSQSRRALSAIFCEI